ncbi:MAG: Fic family protein [endosymbiont of Escarpia spicata]|uniref:Fic family protein n=1 Tax=endosymbiont of Escarpia spicata TaxID=2200908 RepID=A0A370DNF9_9GAMM|nr:MAG: Fic family protein [endosymbiont of Escarpia spicata]
MQTTSHDFSPFIPSNAALEASDLADKAVTMITASAKLAGGLPGETRNTITRHMAVINSYYSNLIEGNRTRPHEIRAAQRGDFSSDPAKRDLQMESLAHIKVQEWIREQAPTLDKVFSTEFIQTIHREFYQQVPESLRLLKNAKGEIVDEVVPGQWRTKEVTVGRHHPPRASDLLPLMRQFCEIYHPGRYKGEKKIIATLCAHHRFAWIHPFADGNGRVARLLTDSTLSTIDIESYGVWCLSRGLARASDRYKTLLERADFSRQGDHDGRGLLSERNLVEFCDFMLDIAIDQIDYISGLLQIDQLRTRIQGYVHARNDGRIPDLGSIKPVAALILYNAFMLGKLDRAIALELCAMPERSARRLLSQLREEGLLSETSSKSPLRWAIPEHAEPWYFPQLTPGI